LKHQGIFNMNYKKLLALILTLVSFYAIAIDSSQTNVKLTSISTPDVFANQDIVITPSGTGSMKVDTSTSLIIPKGSTGARPGTPESGMIRWNTTTGSLEAHNGSTWAAVGGGDNLTHLEVTVTTNQVVPAFTAATVNFQVVNDSSDPNGDFDLGTDTFTAPRDAFYRVCMAVTWATATFTAPLIVSNRFTVAGTSYTLGGSIYIWQTGSRPVYIYGCTQVYMTSGQAGIFKASSGRGFNTTITANDSWGTITEVPTSN